MNTEEYENGFTFSPIYLQLILDILFVIEKISKNGFDSFDDSKKKNVFFFNLFIKCFLNLFIKFFFYLNILFKK
jgi:hypothetical protein